MMVRRAIGLYKHPWDPMQIQAPRNVLAETSIDMWALTYTDPESAKAVFAGQFLPYLESIWAMGDYALAAVAVEMIAQRIYPSMDRRTPGDHAGWPA
jgi:hypothetical protein